MAEKLNINKIMRGIEPETEGEALFDLAGEDFLGFEVPAPVKMRWHAFGSGGKVLLHLWLEGQLEASCVRCLEKATHSLEVEKVYDVTAESLEGEFPEFPLSADGYLDLDEMAYGEVVLEAPPLLLCGEECLGLCTVCGSKKSQCGCGDEPEPDARWQALRDLLEE